MDRTTIIGTIAGALTTIAYLPQLIKVLKTRSTRDISLGMFVTLCLGLLMWTVYGFSIHSLPVIVANIVSLAMSFVIVLFKIRGG